MKSSSMKSFPLLLNLKKQFTTAYNLQLQLHHHVKNSYIVFKVAWKHLEIMLNTRSQNIFNDLFFRDSQSQLSS